MQILAVSDRVIDHLYEPDVAQRYPDVELIIGCGDLPYYYLEFLVSATDKSLVFVRGNHDAGEQYTADGRVLTGVQGGLDLHGRVARVNGLLIAGLEGSMRYRPNSPHMYTEREMRFNALKLIPHLLLNVAKYGRALDILVTHSPPLKIHDGEDIAHRGFAVFLALMKYFRPRYLLHGHMHVHRNTTQTVTKYEDTIVVNVFPYFGFKFGDSLE